METTAPAYNLLVISNHKNNLSFSDNNQTLVKVVSHNGISKIIDEEDFLPDVIVIDAKDEKTEDIETILSTIKPYNIEKILINGKVDDKEKLYAINRNIFFWNNHYHILTYNDIVQLFKLKSAKNKFKDEVVALKKKSEIQGIMLAELEQTNNNLISATWRERNLKAQLKQAMDDLQQSKELIELQNKKISESINYSRRIQNVILPDEQLIREELPESFIYYKPKDVVSGDFPFYLKKGDDIFIAAVDCTGHGVPGAMLSLIAYLTLTDIINDPDINNTSDILKQLHSKIVITLKQNVPDNDASDGMDIALCRINKANNVLCFSGAHRPLYLVRNNEITEYKGSKFPIGGTQYRKEYIYEKHQVILQSGDSFYMCSDGFPDQFGGENYSKYGATQLKEVILKNNHKPMGEIKETLKNEFINWKGEKKQLDDILFMGLRF